MEPRLEVVLEVVKDDFGFVDLGFGFGPTFLGVGVREGCGSGSLVHVGVLSLDGGKQKYRWFSTTLVA